MDEQPEATPPTIVTETPPPPSFYARVPDAFVYPFRGAGWAAIIAGAVFFWLLNFLSWLPFLGLLIGVFVGGYLAAFMMKVLGASAGGEDAPPDWPALTSFWEDVLKPLVLVIATVIVSMLPAMGYVVYLRATGGLGSWGPLAEDGSWWDDPVFGVLLLVAALYFPMGLIAAALHDSSAGLGPPKVLAGILRTLPGYLLAAVVFFLCYVVSGLAQAFLTDAVPLIDGLIAGAVILYFIMVEMRILGLLYRANARRLGWFE